ncbi:hypothetical protein GF339_11715, partial [candidate division KSB3 bacterium]|nr:hypothetical protein [candidate division KSB3 bacterium]MBD3325245.1 hypothetical protein [candidate division KSB3 bacterium]
MGHPLQTSVFQRIQRATLMLMAGTLAVNGLGFAKSLLIAAYYGTSPALDAYVLSLAPLNLLSGVLVGTLQATIIPRYLELHEKQGADYAFAVFRTFLL